MGLGAGSASFSLLLHCYILYNHWGVINYGYSLTCWRREMAWVRIAGSGDVSAGRFRGGPYIERLNSLWQH